MPGFYIETSKSESLASGSDENCGFRNSVASLLFFSLMVAAFLSWTLSVLFCFSVFIYFGLI